MRDESKTAVESLLYPDAGGGLPDFWSELPRLDDPSAASGSAGRPFSASSPAPKVTFSREDVERKFQAGREQGIREGGALERQAQAARLHEIEQARIAQAAASINQFAGESERFFASIEKEMVALALAIAERILRREAQVDPLFLLGAVRVALGQLAENIHVSLHVPASEAELWSETLIHLPNLKIRPEIVPDARMQVGDCLIESEMGHVDLGLQAQIHSMQHALLEDAMAPTHPVQGKGSEESQ